MTANADPHAAPGRLETLRRFLNTAGLESGREDLASAESAGAWIREADLPYKTLDEAELRRLRELRETFRAVFLAHNGQGDAASAQGRLAEVFSEARLRMEWNGPAGAPALRPDESAPNVTESALLAIAYDAVAYGTWSRMKACRKESCRWAFYDRSKNGSGAWCSMAVCGNRVKAQRRRARVTKVGP